MGNGAHVNKMGVRILAQQHMLTTWGSPTGNGTHVNKMGSPYGQRNTCEQNGVRLLAQQHMLINGVPPLATEHMLTKWGRPIGTAAHVNKMGSPYWNQRGAQGKTTRKPITAVWSSWSPETISECRLACTDICMYAWKYVDVLEVWCEARNASNMYRGIQSRMSCC